MPRYVLLRHDCPTDYRNGPHWDFMLQHGGVLWTWSLEALPAAWCERLKIVGGSSREMVPATRLADHRLAYLDYEGPVSGDRGEVQRVAEGEFEWNARDASRVEVAFGAGTLRGSGALALVQDEQWLLTSVPSMRD